MNQSLALLLLLACLSIVCAVKPTHITLSHSGDVTNMRVSWMTPTVYKYTSVYWWEQPANTQHIVNVTNDGTTTTFVKPNNLGTQYITTCQMGRYTKLVAGRSYTYQIRLDKADSTTWSAVYDFKALPAPKTPITLGIYGDLGSLGPVLLSTNAYGLKAYATAHKFDLIMHNGDLAYNLGARNGTVGESFFTNVQDITARIPYHATPGNHEYWTSDQSLQYYNGWFAAQTKLGTLSGSTKPLLWYSFDISYAHIIVVNTEVYCEDLTQVVAHYNWLKNDLATYRAANPTGWIVALGHRQMYLGTTGAFDSYLQRYGFTCTNPADYTTCDRKKPCYTFDSAKCGWGIESLYLQYKVDVSFEGHQHIYQRFYPIGNNYVYEKQTSATYVNPQYPIHIISGAAGMASQGFRSMHEERALPPHVAFQSTSQSINSFTTMKIINVTHAYFEQVSCNTPTPGIQDKFWVVRDRTKPKAATGTFTVTATTATGCQ